MASLVVVEFPASEIPIVTTYDLVVVVVVGKVAVAPPVAGRVGMVGGAGDGGGQSLGRRRFPVKPVVQ